MGSNQSSAPQGAHPSQSTYGESGMYVFVGSMIFTILFFVYVSFFSGGVKIQEVREAQTESNKTESKESAAPAAPAVEPAAGSAPAGETGK